jgi:hypothetical protein
MGDAQCVEIADSGDDLVEVVADFVSWKAVGFLDNGIQVAALTQLEN